MSQPTDFGHTQMITPSHAKFYSPYSLSGEQSGLFWQVETEMTAAAEIRRNKHELRDM
jgi:hypothetical protein